MRLLPNGDVIQVGDNGNTAIFNPSTDTNTGGGTWTAGPAVPGGYVSDDAPGVLLPDGQFLFTADQPGYNSPTHVFDYNYSNNTITDITPTAANGDPRASCRSWRRYPSYTDRFLMLPNGQALFTVGGTSALCLHRHRPGKLVFDADDLRDHLQRQQQLHPAGSALNGASQGADLRRRRRDGHQLSDRQRRDRHRHDLLCTTTDWNMTGVGVTNGATRSTSLCHRRSATPPSVTADALEPDCSGNR